MFAQKLLGVTYAEFDNTVGPKLLYSFPEHVMSKECFEDLSDYVIVGKHLCKKIIVVQNNEIKYMNYSVAIDNPKYERNALLFSLGFVLPVDEETEPFEPILRKLASVLLALEDEREFLFVDTSKTQLQEVLQRLYIDLSSKGETFIQLDENNVLATKVFESPQPPLEIPDYRVPVVRFSKIAQINIPWDISLNYVLSRIDGVSHVKKIAAKRPAIDIECVRRCLRTLLFYDCIIISDIVQLSNVYVLQRLPCQQTRSSTVDGIGNSSHCHHHMYDMIVDPVGNDMMHEIIEFSSLSIDPYRNMNEAQENHHRNNHHSLSSIDEYNRRTANVTKLLLKFRAGKQLGQVLLSCGVNALVGLDIRRLLAIAQDRGLLRRLHEYPVYVCRSLPGCHPQSMENANGNTFDYRNNTNIGAGVRGRSNMHDNEGSRGHNYGDMNSFLSRFDVTNIDGSLCLDAICCGYGLSNVDVLEKPDQFFVVYR